VVLTRVLEASGLREGYEYETQVSIENDARSRMQPDVIVRLPQGKDVVIDAKMTLVAYERYFNAEDDYIRESALQEHIASVRNHIRLLGRKDYQQLPGLRSLDYVLMFIPVEPAFLLALDRQPELITEALKNNIMLVSPTTLLVAYGPLRTCGATSTRAATRSRLPIAPASCTTKCACLWTICPRLGKALIARRITTVRR
jgi:DNA recombination protein RmuC